MEYQAYGLDKNGQVTHAGTFKAKKLTNQRVEKYQREWEKWRLQYLAQEPGNFPLRQDFNDPERTTHAIIVHPIAQPEKEECFVIDCKYQGLVQI